MKLYRINALLLKYYYITINNIERIFDILYWPLIDLFVWGFASFYIKDLSNVNLLSMLIGGVILWTFVWRSSQDIAIFVLEDFWSRNLYHLFSSPVKISEHMISIILIGILRALVTFIVLISLAFLMYSFNIFRINIFFLCASIFSLSLFGWVVGLFVTALILRFGQRIQVLAWSTVWVVQPFSCIFYPLNALPSWARVIAKFLPTSYIFENLRSILFGNPLDYIGLVYSLLINIILLITVILFLKSSFNYARKTGLLARGD